MDYVYNICNLISDWFRRAVIYFLFENMNGLLGNMFDY